MRRFTRLSAVAAVAVTTALAGAVLPPVAAAQAGPTRDDVPRIEPLRLECRARVTDSSAAVRCDWSAPTSASAAHVELFRFDPAVDEHREVVYRSNDLGVTSFTDVDVRRGHRYAYAVVAGNADGRTVGRSRVEWVAVPDSADVEVLRLHCTIGSNHEAIGCEWSPPETADAAVVSLWRSVNGGERELVDRFRPSGPTAYRDPVPVDATHVTYTVIATSESDRVVARSRPSTVRIPQTADRPDRPATARTERATL
jgi:hypothetical protein